MSRAPVASGRAAVLVTPSRVTVGKPGAEIVISRRPFRIRFLSRSRNPQLAEVANTQPAPSVLPPTADPVAPGTEPARSGQLYAPLSFLVGSETLTQYSGGVWGGNLMSGQRSGVQYAARNVTSVRRHGSGVVLTVSTNDPGRTLGVTIASLGKGRSRLSRRPIRAAAWR